MFLGRALRRNASRAELVDKIRELEKAIQSLTPARAPNSLLSVTRAGTAVRPQSQRAEEAAGLRWRGEWTSGTPGDGLGDYEENDVVIRAGSASLNQGIGSLSNGMIASTFVLTTALASSLEEETKPEELPQRWAMLARSFYPNLSIVHRESWDIDGENGDPETPAKIAFNAVVTGPKANVGNAAFDLNVLNGWTAAWREVEVCINGETWYMKVHGTPAYRTQGEHAPTT